MKARAICRAELAELGFSVSEENFTFSELPGRYAPALGALAVALLSLATGVTSVKSPGLALLVLLGGGALLGLAGHVIAASVTRLGVMRASSANLVAVRGAEPTVWLAAHLDSKSQTIAMLVRVASVIASAVFLCALGLVLAAHATSELAGFAEPAPEWRDRLALAEAGLALLAALSAIPMVICFTGNRSPGALDNASGVVAVLETARLVDASRSLGVVLTSGEELGLAGARAFVETRKGNHVAINCDSIDDAGTFFCMRARGRRNRAAQAMTRAARRVGLPISVRGTIPGILADHIAFAHAGWEAVTLSRGNLGTLSRVHTARDRIERFEGAGIATAVRLLEATVAELS